MKKEDEDMKKRKRGKKKDRKRKIERKEGIKMTDLTDIGTGMVTESIALYLMLPVQNVGYAKLPKRMRMIFLRKEDRTPVQLLENTLVGHCVGVGLRLSSFC